MNDDPKSPPDLSVILWRLDELEKRLSVFVTNDTYEWKQAALMSRVGELEKRYKRDDESHDNMKLLVTMAILSPFLVTIVNILMDRIIH